MLSTRNSDYDSVPVSITFDDGNKIQHQKFFPVLREYGINASFYVTVDWIGRRFKMSWNDLKEIHEAGNEIGSHTCTHPHLTQLSEMEIDRELRRSRDLLSKLECRSLAYPFGEYDERVIDCARRYYIAARGYYDIATQSRDYGHNYGARDEIYKLKVFPTEGAFPSKRPCLLAQPLSEFQRSIQGIVEWGIRTRGWAIFVLHGTLGNLHSSMRYTSLRGCGSGISLRYVPMLTPYLIRRGQISRFRWMCRYFERNKDIRVMTVSEVIQQLQTPSKGA